MYCVRHDYVCFQGCHSVDYHPVSELVTASVGARYNSKPATQNWQPMEQQHRMAASADGKVFVWWYNTGIESRTGSKVRHPTLSPVRCFDRWTC